MALERSINVLSMKEQKKPCRGVKVFKELDKARTRGDLIVAYMPHSLFFSEIILS